MTGVFATSEGTSAILVSTDGRLIMQLRDDLPHVLDRGMIGPFGGGREGEESFLECVAREIHEEVGLDLPPERFEKIGFYFGPHTSGPSGTLREEIFVVRDVPIGELNVMEGSLRIVTLEELRHIQDLLSPMAKYALKIFMKGQ